MKYSDSLLDIINDFAKEGYTRLFTVNGHYLECAELNIKSSHDQFDIVKIYRCEDDTDSA